MANASLVEEAAHRSNEGGKALAMIAKKISVPPHLDAPIKLVAATLQCQHLDIDERGGSMHLGNCIQQGGQESNRQHVQKGSENVAHGGGLARRWGTSCGMRDEEEEIVLLLGSDLGPDARTSVW